MFKLVFLNLKTIIKNKLIIIYLIFFLGCEAVLCKFSSTHVDARDGTSYFSSYTCNDNGTFWVRLIASGGIHEGNGSVSN